MTLFTRLTFALTAALVTAGCEPKTASDSSAPVIESTTTGETATARLRLAPSTLTVAQTLELVLSVEAAETPQVTWPDVASIVADSFDVANERPLETKTSADGDVIAARRYELQPIVPGTQEIPPLPIMLADGETIATPPATVIVESVLDEAAEAELAPRKGVAEPPADVRFWGLLAAGSLTGAALFGATIYFLVRRHRLRRQFIPARPAHEVALERLNALLAEDLIARGRFEQFLNRLSGILRHYIEDRFSIHAPQQTTEEFLEAARASGALQIDRTTELGLFLKRCDLVKFARAAADPHDLDQAVAMVRAFIENSKAPADPGNGDVSDVRGVVSEVAA